MPGHPGNFLLVLGFSTQLGDGKTDWLGVYWLAIGGKMKKFSLVFSLLIILLLSVICQAAKPYTEYGTKVAIEIKNPLFPKTRIVGYLEYTRLSIDIVTFVEIWMTFSAYSQVYSIDYNNVIAKGVHHVHGKNQNGVTISGTIDFADSMHPKVYLVTNSGVTIKNISDKNREWCKKRLPNIDLGQ